MTTATLKAFFKKAAKTAKDAPASFTVYHGGEQHPAWLIRSKADLYRDGIWGGLLWFPEGRWAFSPLSRRDYLWAIESLPRGKASHRVWIAASRDVKSYKGAP